MDMRAEVGLLSRNIVVRGEVEDRCYPYSNHVCNFFDFDTFGGHIKVWDPGRWGDGNRSQEQVQGLCGRQVPPPRVLFRQSTPGRKTGGDPVGDGHPLPAHTAPGLPLSTAPATSLPRSLLQCFARVLSQRSRHFTHTRRAYNGRMKTQTRTQAGRRAGRGSAERTREPAGGVEARTGTARRGPAGQGSTGRPGVRLMGESCPRPYRARPVPAYGTSRVAGAFHDVESQPIEAGCLGAPCGRCSRSRSRVCQDRTSRCSD